jgi:hypothetical protein
VVAHPFLLETYQTHFIVSYENLIHFLGNVLAVVNSSHLSQTCGEDGGYHFGLEVLANDNACGGECSLARSVGRVCPNHGNHFFTDADGVDDSFDSLGSVMEKMVAVSVSGRHFVVPLSFFVP